jgi:hypothetical protein
MLSRAHTLEDGHRVRLRNARPSDSSAIAQLLEERGVARSEPPELDVYRLIRFDPRRRLAICATALIGNVEQIVAVGSIAIGADAPELVVARSEPAGELVRLALLSRAAEIGARTAA